MVYNKLLMKNQKSLKVLHITTHLNIGGISSYLLILGSGMIKKGHQVCVLSSGGGLSEEFKEREFHLLQFNIKTKSELNPKLYWALPQIIRLVKEKKFDIIHAHTRVTQVLAYFIARATGVPVVTTAHGYYKPRFGRRLFGCWGGRTIAISPLVAEELKNSHAVDPSRIKVVQNAIDTEDFLRRLAQKNTSAVRKEYGIDEKAVVLGSVSRLVQDKGHEYLVKALSALRKKNVNAFLLILGDGRERDNLQKLIKDLNLERHVKLVPGEKDVTKVLSVMDIFVHPATFREGFGLSMMEAMIAGKPVVVTDIWAVNSYIKNAVNGYLVEPKNTQALADAIHRVISDPSLSKQVAEEGRRMAAEICSLDRMTGETEAVYQEAIEEGHGKRF